MLKFYEEMVKEPLNTTLIQFTKWNTVQQWFALIHDIDLINTEMPTGKAFQCLNLTNLFENVSPGSDFGPEGLYTPIQKSPHHWVLIGWWLWEGAMPCHSVNPH